MEYELRLQRKEKEAHRILIEAKAQAETKQIISSSLDDRVLKDKGIKATLELAHSQYSKVIIIGGGEDEFLLILGGQ